MKEVLKNKFLELCAEDGFDISDTSNPQYKAVMDNVSIIPAGAGSGKTAVLSHRFLRLVLDGIHCDEILTITFTKDATANMKGKIFKILSSAKDKGLIDKAELDKFSKAAISTTDSFCSQIVREDCVRYGISSTFSIDEDDNLKKEASGIIRRIIENRKDDAELKYYLSMLSVNDIEETFIKLASDYCSIANPPLQNFSVVKNSILQEFKYDTIEEDIKDLIQPARDYLYDLENNKAKFKEGSYGLKNITLLEAFLAAEDKKDFFLQNDERPGGNVGKKELRNLCVKPWEDLLLRCRVTSEKSLKFLGYLFGLISEFSGQFLRYKRESGLLSFNDVMKLSIDILKTNQGIRDRYRRKFKAVMVDEFQDNNDDNRVLVYLLAANDSYTGGHEPAIDEIDIDKVFMVGDEKQSIYRFRNADVTVFKKMISDFGKSRTVLLQRNFRSEKTVIDCINDLFCGLIIPDKAENIPDYEAVYEALKSDKNLVDNPHVEFHYLEEKNGSDEFKDIEIEALDVAETIREMVDGEDYMVCTDSSGTRKPKYSDIAILLKKYTHQQAFEKALKAYGIPFESPENKSLTLDAVANDFCSLLQVAVYGESDTVSFYAFLKSPLCSMTDAELSALKTSEDSSERLKDVRLKIWKIADNLGKNGIADSVRMIWEDLGYRFIALKNKQAAASAEEHYNYLYSLAVDYDSKGKSVVQFLSKLREFYGKENGIKDITVQREQEVGVKIMSIYKSKGLEFPIVFVSDMGCRASGKGGFEPNISLSGDNVIMPYYLDAEDGKLRNPYVKTGKNDKTAKDNAETKRVLYVAATRAMQHLIFTGVVPNEVKEELNETSGINMIKYFLRSLGCTKEKDKSLQFRREVNGLIIKRIKKPEKNDEGTPDNPESTGVSSTIESWYEETQGAFRFNKYKFGVTTLVRKGENKPKGLKADLLPSVPCDSVLMQVKADDVSTLEDDSFADDEENDNPAITAFGTLVHSMLENAVLGVDDSREYGQFFSHPEKKMIKKSAEILRDNFVNSDFRKKLRGYSLYPEKKFYTYEEADNVIVEGIIDLLCVKDGEAVIVDYKTDHYRNPETHRKQLEYYKKAVESIYPGYKVSAFLFYLRSGEAVKIC